MKDWYELTNDLETKVQPLDEVTQARIQKKVRTALPRRKKQPLRVVAAIAAVLVLSACGYAVVTGQFSNWFWNKATDPQAPESSEDLLASMGTVIGQTQTVSGFTMTLHGAIWDGQTMMLSLTLEGDEAPSNHWTSVDTEDSWFQMSKEQAREYLKTSLPYMTEEELDAYAEEYYQVQQTWFRPLSIDYFYNRQTSAYGLQVESPLPFSGDSVELTLHLENLTIDGVSVRGPFEFTFTVDKQSVELVYLGEADMEPVEGYPIRITKVTLSPLRVSVHFTGLEQTELRADGEMVSPDFSLDALRVVGGEQSLSGQWSGRYTTGPDGSWEGSVSRGPFTRVLDPTTVEAIRINDSWLELNDFTLSETTE